MLLQCIVSAGLKYLPPRVFRSSVKDYNKFLLFLTNPPLRVCSSLSVSGVSDLFDDPNVQKYLNYIINEAGSKIRPKDSILTESEIYELNSLLDKKRELDTEMKTLESMSSEGNKELKALIETEKREYLQSIEQLKSDILNYILPGVDENDNRNAELKIIPGIGGEEAKLFAAELFDMYCQYCEFKNWEYSNDINSFLILINGEDAFGNLKQEAGVHRVQRVPVTESSGRTQTSTCSVVVLPQPEPHEVRITEKDIIVEKMKSSGPGGQNVNKRETCIRIKHIPTGITVENQTSRKQEDNLKEALRRLRTILFNMEQEKLLSERRSSIIEQKGVNDYSDKIRTYHYQQSRVTDHRIGYTTQNLRGFLSGGKDLDHVIKEVRSAKSRQQFLLNVKSTLESLEYKEFEKQHNR